MNETPEFIRSFMRKLIQCPFYAITISPILFGVHKNIVTKETWIKAQVGLLKEIGPESYFKSFLEMLENPLTKEEFDNMSDKDAGDIIRGTSPTTSPYFQPDR